MNLNRTCLLRRLVELDRPTVEFTLDGQRLKGLRGDTVLTAVLTQAQRLRTTEFSRQPRAGFCLMGSCQDCWIGTAGGGRIQACATFIEPDMQLITLGSDEQRVNS